MLAACFVAATAAGGIVGAQQSVIVPTVADSPTALELILRADEQAATNPGESARLAAELLRDLADKLVQTKRPGVYQGVADQVAGLLAAHPEVLERYRNEVGAQAREWLADERLVEVVTRFAATDAGLEAMLRLAGRALQDARADEASAWLRRASMHPSSALDPAPRLALEALAAWAAGDRAAWSARAAELAAVPGVERSLVDAIGAMGEPTARVQRAAIGDVAPDTAAEIPAMPWIEAWSVPLAWSPASIRNRGIVPVEEMLGQDDTLRARSRLHTIVPIIDADEVIVADGRVLSCFDLLTHSMRWQAMIAIDQAARSADTMTTPCVVDAERVHSVVTVGELGGLVSSRVVSVRRSDGRTLWQRSLEEGDGLLPGGLRVAGSMALAGDVLAVPCLRQNGRLELACWLIGLDAEDGSTRWSVPLGAANGLLAEFGNAPPVRGGMAAVAHRGVVLVGTMVGTAACIEAPTGAVRWIARDELARTRQQQQQAWEASAPVIDGDTAWFLHADARVVMRRSLADGTAILTQALGRGEPLGAAQYLVGSPGTIVGVSSDGALSAIDVNEPAARRWQLPAPDLEPLVGRAVLARSGDRAVIVLPRANRIDVIDLVSGVSVGSMPVRRSGAVGVGGDRVAIASEMNLEVWGRADRIVADLVALVERGTAPDAELALAESALSQGDTGRALEMARRALARLSGAEVDDDVMLVRGRVVDVLLELVRRSPDGDDAVEVLRRSSLLPSQSLRVALALADRHAARSEWADAARTLADAVPALDADPFVEHGGASVRTSQVLSMAMQRMVARAHAAGSNAIEQAADQAVRSGASASPEAIARSWRGTTASIRILVESCERARADERLDAAARCAQRAALITLERADAGLPIEPTLIDRVAARVIDVGGGNLLAAATLRRLHRVVPSATAFATIAAGDQWIIAPRWARADGAPRAGRRAIQFSASLPALDAFALRQSTPDRAVLVVNQQLVGIMGSTLAPEWAIELEDPSPGIVRMLPTMLVLERTMTLPGRLRGVDPSTGAVSWSIEDLGLLLGPVQPIAGLRDDENVLSRRGSFAALPLGDGAVAVRGDGSCVRIGADGRPRWTSTRSLPLVEHVQSSMGGLALVGTSLDSDPALTLISSVSGQELGGVDLEGMASVDAVESTLCGFVVTRGLASALIEDTEAGPRILWERSSPPGATRRMPAVVLDEAMFMGQPTDGSYRLDLDDGSSTALDWDGGIAGAWSPLVRLDDGLLFAKGDRVVLAQATGRIVGSAQLGPSATPQLAIPCDGGVIVQALGMPELPAVQGGSTFTLLDPSQGLRQLRTLARLMVPVGWRRAMLLDGWILLFGEDQCIAIPVGAS